MTQRVPYTEQQQAEFKATFAKRKRLQIGSFIAAFGAFALSFALPASIAFPFGPPGPPAGVLVIPIVVLISLVVWRCPACGKILGNEWSPNFCSKCGVELQ